MLRFYFQKTGKRCSKLFSSCRYIIIVNFLGWVRVDFFFILGRNEKVFTVDAFLFLHLGFLGNGKYLTFGGKYYTCSRPEEEEEVLTVLYRYLF